ncbi:hypothetical protein [Nostoc sp.]
MPNDASCLKSGIAGRQSLMGETPKTALAPQRTASPMPHAQFPIKP